EEDEARRGEDDPGDGEQLLLAERESIVPVPLDVQAAPSLHHAPPPPRSPARRFAPQPPPGPAPAATSRSARPRWRPSVPPAGAPPGAFLGAGTAARGGEGWRRGRASRYARF